MSIRLPFEAATTQFLADDPKLVNFRYFFTRKVTFVKEAHGFVLLPGGFGTLDEAFELLTLVQTGKAPPAPIVLLDVPGGTYWQTLDAVRRARAARTAATSRPTTSSSCTITDDVARRGRRGHRLLPQLPLAAVRRRRPRAAHAARCPTADALDALNDEFADIVASGAIEPAEASKAEIADDDVPELARLRLRFDRHSYAPPAAS